MQLTSLVGFTSPYGRLDFFTEKHVPPCRFKMYWHAKGLPTCRLIGYTQLNPTPKLAIFFIRKSVAEDRGESRYKYTDSNTDPVYQP